MSSGVYWLPPAGYWLSVLVYWLPSEANWPSVLVYWSLPPCDCSAGFWLPVVFRLNFFTLKKIKDKVWFDMKMHQNVTITSNNVSCVYLLVIVFGTTDVRLVLLDRV